jgi:transcriptional regulator with GAF, ATPase, and Fis domain
MNKPTPSNVESVDFTRALKEKNLSPDKLAKLRLLMPEEVEAYEASRPVNVALAEFVTAEPSMLRIKEKVKILSEVNDPVLITGETGTGKELLAKALHGDREGKLITVNCAGIPEALIESELFGHKKGAFTSAIADKTGLLQAAYNGTIFLDEVGDLPLQAQAKLLRALQEKCIRRVGDDGEEIKITCRFVCATHRNLPLMVASSAFREDLYWRISTVTLTTKPIRERTIDIPLIVKHLVIKDRDKVHHDIDLEEMTQYIIKNRDRLTGNVRQIQSIVRNFHLFGELPQFSKQAE